MIQLALSISPIFVAQLLALNILNISSAHAPWNWPKNTTCESYVGRMLPGADILEVETADGVKLPIPLFHPCTCLPTQTVHSVKHPQTKLKTNNCKWKSTYLSHLAPAYPQKQCQAPANQRETHKNKSNCNCKSSYLSHPCTCTYVQTPTNQ